VLEIGMSVTWIFTVEASAGAGFDIWKRTLPKSPDSRTLFREYARKPRFF
jgi:hypothetical protein